MGTWGDNIGMEGPEVGAGGGAGTGLIQFREGQMAGYYEYANKLSGIAKFWDFLE